MPLKTTRFNASDHIQTAEDAAEFIQAAFEELPTDIAIRQIKAAAEYKGMAELARETGVSRPGLYKAFSEDGDPKLSTLSSVLKTFGLRLTVTPLETADG